MSEENKKQDRRESNNMEKHIQTVLVILVAAILTWVGVTTNETAKSVISMDTNMGWMQKSIEKMQVQLDEVTKNRYTKEDALQDKTTFLYRIQACEKRLDVIESKGRHQ